MASLADEQNLFEYTVYNVIIAATTAKEVDILC